MDDDIINKLKLISCTLNDFGEYFMEKDCITAIEIIQQLREQLAKAREELKFYKKEFFDQ